MTTLYFGFAIADSMFTGDFTVTRKEIKDPGMVDHLLRFPNHVWCQEVKSCLNPSHKPTIDAMIKRYGFEVEIPLDAHKVNLQSGDALIVMSPRGLPRMIDRHEYTEEEIANCEFSFSIWQVE